MKLSEQQRREIIHTVLQGEDKSLCGSIGIFPSDDVQDFLDGLPKKLRKKINRILSGIVQRVYDEVCERDGDHAVVATLFGIEDHILLLYGHLYMRYNPTYGIADLISIQFVTERECDRLKNELSTDQFCKGVVSFIEEHRENRISDAVEEMKSILLNKGLN